MCFRLFSTDSRKYYDFLIVTDLYDFHEAWGVDIFLESYVLFV